MTVVPAITAVAAVSWWLVRHADDFSYQMVVAAIAVAIGALHLMGFDARSELTRSLTRDSGDTPGREDTSSVWHRV